MTKTKAKTKTKQLAASIDGPAAGAPFLSMALLPASGFPRHEVKEKMTD